MPSGATGPTPTVDPAAAAAEIQRLRDERDAARAELREAKHPKQSRPRRTIVGALVVLFSILVPVAVTTAWAHQTVLDTSRFESTIAPIADSPAVQTAVARTVTDQLYAALQPEQVVAAALPPKAAFLAGPIANGSKSYVQTGVTSVLSSAQFRLLWLQAISFAHGQIVSALRGSAPGLQTTNGQVVLSLVPVLNAALQHIQGFASSVTGRSITVPTLTGKEIPSDACAKISAAIGRPLPSTCGQIPLFPAAKLAAARKGVRVFDRGVIVLLVVTPLLAAAAVAISRRRRRTLFQLMIGGMLGLVVFRRSGFWLQGRLVDTGRPENKSARSAILHDLLRGYFSLTGTLLLLGAVIVVIAAVTGPYRWARRMREIVANGGRAGGTLISDAVAGPADATRQDAPLLWVRRRYDLLRGVGVAAAVVLLIAVSVSFVGLLVIVALLVAYEFLLYRLRPPERVTLPAAPPPRAPL